MKLDVLSLIAAGGGVRGRALPGWIEGVGTYASTYDAALTVLKVRHCRNVGYSRLVPLVIMHGFSETSSFIPLDALRYLADRGFLLLVVEMRGRNGSSGDEDASGRELGDVLDAVRWARASIPGVDLERCAIAGWSGGGGNALALACKAPDFFTYYVSHFGMSDYGYHPTYGWYAQAGFDALLDDWIGDPGVSLDPYRARNVLESIATTLRYSKGERIRLYHDVDDDTVNVNQSQRVRDVLLAAGISHSYNESNSGSPFRYTHADPVLGAGVMLAAPEWVLKALNAKPWSFPATGDCRVIGWQVNRRFELWAGEDEDPRTNGEGGLTRAVDVQWNVGTGSYLVTPLNGDCWVQIVQGGLTAQELITEATVLEVS
jgi:pimeloyl-ACP methyl ester carboxylesterase